jgi:NADH:ubiquinone oxidoreductase subunit 6 (subunit J)
MNVSLFSWLLIIMSICVLATDELGHVALVLLVILEVMSKISRHG